MFVKNIQTWRLRVFIVSFGVLISHKKIQHDSSSPSFSKFAIKFTMGITIENEPKNRLSLKKPFLMVLVQMWDHFFNSNVIKWSQNWTRTIRSGVFGIANFFLIISFACIFQIFGYANNTISDGPSAILRPLYNILRCRARLRAGAFSVASVSASNQPRGHDLRQQSLRP